MNHSAGVVVLVDGDRNPQRIICDLNDGVCDATVVLGTFVCSDHEEAVRQFEQC